MCLQKKIAIALLKQIISGLTEASSRQLFAEDLQVYIKLFNKESTTPLKKLTKISVCKVLNKKTPNRKCLAEIDKLLQIYRCIALVSASAERCFSTMKKIKTWHKAL